MRGRNLLIYSLVLVVAVLVQGSLLSHLKIAAYLDLLLVLSVLMGLAGGPREGFFLGMGMGLVQDLMAGRFLGLFTLAKAGVGYVAGEVAQRVYRDRFVTPALMCVAGTILHRFFLTVAVSIGEGATEFAFWPKGLALAALSNGLAGGLLFGPVTRLHEWLSSSLAASSPGLRWNRSGR